MIFSGILNVVILRDHLRGVKLIYSVSEYSLIHYLDYSIGYTLIKETLPNRAVAHLSVQLLLTTEVQLIVEKTIIKKKKPGNDPLKSSDLIGSLSTFYVTGTCPEAFFRVC